MKRKQRERTLNALFAELASADFDRREQALFQLRLMLVRSNAAGRGDDLPEYTLDSLTREQRRLRLSHAEQQAAVDRLSVVIATKKESRATAFWTLGAAAPAIGFAPSLAMLMAVGDQLDREAAFQVCSALERWLAGDVVEWVGARDAIDADDPRPQLRAWTESDDARLARAAKRALASVHAVIA